MSGQFFGVYTLENTAVGEIMKDTDEIKYITGEDDFHDVTTTIDSTGYVDDVSHVIGNQDTSKLEEYARMLRKVVTKEKEIICA